MKKMKNVTNSAFWRGNSIKPSHNQDFSLIETFNNLALWGEKKFVSKLKRTYKFQRGANNFFDKVHSLFTTHNSLKRPAFTLAEVLITLGIIGVVAAMTMPSLIQNYQRHVWLTQLKKSYSVLTNGFKAMLAEDNVDFLYDTSLFNSIKPINEYGRYCSLNNYDTLTRSDCKDFFEKFKQYFPNSVYVKIVNTYENKNKK